MNSEGLPASVFRTDEWDDVEAVVISPAVKEQEFRRAFAAEIKALAAKRETLDKESPEYAAIQKEFQEKMVRFRETSPKAKN